MNVKKCLVLFLAICLSFSVLSLVVAAEDTTATKDTFLLGFTLGEFISLAIAAALLLLIIVLCIVKREKLAESLRAYKRELKNVTWFSWKNVWRCTVFVIVSVLVVAAVIGLLDYVFFQGQYLLVDLLGG